MVAPNGVVVVVAPRARAIVTAVDATIAPNRDES